jgi:molybdopterin synthase sulfur carrier subunit
VRTGADRSSIPTRGTADSTLVEMAIVRLFAAARDAAGTARDEVTGDTVAEVLAAAAHRYGDAFVAVLASSRIWVNGEPAQPQDKVGSTDELAVLPPVSGG